MHLFSKISLYFYGVCNIRRATCNYTNATEGIKWCFLVLFGNNCWVVGVWEAVSDNCQIFFSRTQLKGAKVVGLLNEGPRCNDLQYLKWERSQTHKHIHMLAFLRVTTPSWVPFQWKVPNCSAKLLTRAKQSGYWEGRKESWGEVGKGGGVKRSRELSTSWDMCWTRCLRGALISCTDQHTQAV